jgi:Bacterial PH domain
VAGCENGRVKSVRFRHNVAVALAGLVAFLGALPVATAGWAYAPILLVPLAVAAWGWRAGTDADAEGVTVRALLGRRRFPWSGITGLAPVGRRVAAVLADGRSVTLPAVSPSDLPKLVAASGEELASTRSVPD